MAIAGGLAYHDPMVRTSTSLADRIREARTRAGLSQLELARACGVSPSLVCTVESGRTKSLRDSTLVQMAKVLHQSPEWLAVGDGKAAARATFEQELLADFHRLTAAEKRAVAHMVHELAAGRFKKTGH